MDDQTTPSAPVEETEAPELIPVPVEPESSQPEASTPTDVPPTAPESPINASASVPVEDQNQGVNQAKSDVPEEPISAPNEPQTSVSDQSNPEPIQLSPVQSAPVSAPTPPTPIMVQTQSSAQQDKVGFIRSLLNKANAKLLSNRQKKLNKIIQFAQEKKIIKNDDVQKLLRVSDATATRYLVKLVQQGHLIRVGHPRDAKYQFVQ